MCYTITIKDNLLKEESIIRLKYTAGLAGIISILCSVMVGFYLFSIDKVGDIYFDKSKESIYNIKKDYIKNTVDSLVAEIDLRRNLKISYMEGLVGRTYTLIEKKNALSDSEFNDYIVKLFRDNQDYDFIVAILWDSKENKPVFDSDYLAESTWEETFRTSVHRFSSYRVIIHGNSRLLFGVSSEYVNQRVKADISEVIRSNRFNGNYYIWVNEIFNYEGGKNYAIRRIHPNLPETEGTYLSTDLQDAKGNYPYQEELDGLKKNGEIFLDYYFKEVNSDKVSEKLSYVKLYKNFNWAIGMGVYYDELQPYIDQTNRESKVLVSRFTVVLVFVIIIILVISLWIISYIEKSYYLRTKQQMVREMNHDVLTGAGTRRSGNEALTEAFKEYQQKGTGPGILMFDIDDFKGINDKYGHAVGDMVLLDMVREMKISLRKSDKIIRWGGDEFVVILYGLNEERALDFGNKFLSLMSELQIPARDEKIKITISVGISFFKESDTDFMDVVKRADEALYMSKKEGKNYASMVR